MTQSLEGRFFNDSSIAIGDPSFVLLTGGVGAGKTTIRREKYSEGYVSIDGGDIFGLIVDRPIDKTGPYLEIIDKIGTMFTARALAEHRNIVMEVCGNHEVDLMHMIDVMTARGYQVDVQYIYADPVESFERHVKAIHDDFGYLSSYHTQDLHWKWIASENSQDKQDKGETI